MVLPARQLSRRGAMFGAALLVTSLALGAATLAAVYGQSWTDYRNATDRLQAGAATRIELAASGDVTVGSESVPAASREPGGNGPLQCW